MTKIAIFPSSFPPQHAVLAGLEKFQQGSLGSWCHMIWCDMLWSDVIWYYYILYNVYNNSISCYTFLAAYTYRYMIDYYNYNNYNNNYYYYYYCYYYYYYYIYIYICTWNMNERRWWLTIKYWGTINSVQLVWKVWKKSASFHLYIVWTNLNHQTFLLDHDPLFMLDFLHMFVWLSCRTSKLVTDSNDSKHVFPHYIPFHLQIVSPKIIIYQFPLEFSTVFPYITHHSLIFSYKPTTLTVLSPWPPGRRRLGWFRDLLFTGFTKNSWFLLTTKLL